MTTLIGVTTGFRTISSGEGPTRAHTLYTAFTSMVRRSGGVPVALVPVDPAGAEAVAGRLDGLVLTGGGDIDPARYGGEHHETVHGVEPERDEFEIALVGAAIDRRLPTLAICRGMQVLNVALGGTLVADIASGVARALDHLRKDEDARRAVHTVVLEAGSRLAAALGTSEVEVNSVHHQAIDVPGDGIHVVGRTPDGMIEAVEHARQDWPMWAVQWHPEWLPDSPHSRALFDAVVGAARTASVTR